MTPVLQRTTVKTVEKGVNGMQKINETTWIPGPSLARSGEAMLSNGPMENNAQRHSGTGGMSEKERRKEADGGARKKEQEKEENKERWDLRDVQSLSNSDSTQDLSWGLWRDPPTS